MTHETLTSHVLVVMQLIIIWFSSSWMEWSTHSNWSTVHRKMAKKLFISVSHHIIHRSWWWWLWSPIYQQFLMRSLAKYTKQSVKHWFFEPSQLWSFLLSLHQYAAPNKKKFYPINRWMKNTQCTEGDEEKTLHWLLRFDWMILGVVYADKMLKNLKISSQIYTRSVTWSRKKWKCDLRVR